MNVLALRHAIDLAFADKWEDAHRIVQDYEDEFACWIHAVLHKMEGDDGNSRYWYRRAGREFNTTLSRKEELELIKSTLNVVS